MMNGTGSGTLLGEAPLALEAILIFLSGIAVGALLEMAHDRLGGG
jgi:hypothetical protein